MVDVLEETTQELESTPLRIYRTAAVVKGGRRFSFAALVVVGDRHGTVGIGYGKAPGVPAAIEKAQKAARKNLVKVSLQESTLPHPVTARFGASSVKLVPAAPGTGVIAGGTVRAVLELAGVRDCLTKAYGSTNQKNLAKAAIAGLVSLRTKERIQELRGVELDKTDVELRLEAGRKYAAPVVDRPAKAPAEKAEGKGRGGKGRGGRGGPGQGRGRGRGQGGGQGGQGASGAPQANAAPTEGASGKESVESTSGQQAPDNAPQTEGQSENKSE